MTSVLTPSGVRLRSKHDKGYKFFAEQYLFDYTGKHFRPVPAQMTLAEELG